MALRMTLKIKILKYNRTLKSDDKLESKTGGGHIEEKNIKIFLKIKIIFVKTLKVHKHKINVNNGIFEN